MEKTKYDNIYVCCCLFDEAVLTINSNCFFNFNKKQCWCNIYGHFGKKIIVASQKLCLYNFKK